MDEPGYPPRPCKTITYEAGVQDVDQWAASHLSHIQSGMWDTDGDDGGLDSKQFEDSNQWFDYGLFSSRHQIKISKDSQGIETSSRGRISQQAKIS